MNEQDGQTVEHALPKTQARIHQNASFSTRFQRYKDIVREFAVADFRLRYHDSFLGYIWFLLSPILMFGVYYFVFTEVIYIGVPNYAYYLLLGIISYNFFQDCTFSAMFSLMAKASLIKKVNFPRSLVVFASSVTGTFSLVVNLCLVMIAVLISRGIPPLIWLIPIPLICLFLFSTGVGFILAALYVRFRDFSQIWNVLVLALFWLTPVVYDVTALPQTTQIIVFLNPLARIFMLFRQFLLYDQFYLQFFLITIGASVFVFFLGYAIFRRQQHKIAEQL
jgi:ABC-type polysaccharide/polyol phosphate export permease